MTTTRISIFVSILLSTAAAYAQSSGDSSATESPGSKQHTNKPIETGDFVSPVQEIMYFTNQAALHLTMLCVLNDDKVLAETLMLHNSVKEQVKDRPRLLVILTATEHFTSPSRQGQPSYVPDFFRDADNLVALKERANQARELHRQVLVFVKAYRYREFSKFDSGILNEDSPSLDEVGHPASFLTIESRRHLESLGMPITEVSTTYWRHLERPSHLELGISPYADSDFRQAIQSLKQYRRMHLHESAKGYAAGRRSDAALERVRKRKEERRKFADKEQAK